MKYVFINQGEGRGHLTQAMSMGVGKTMDMPL